MSVKHYLGDAVYVDVEPFGGIVLTTEDGIRATNTIILEPQVLFELERWIAERRKAVAAASSISEGDYQ